MSTSSIEGFLNPALGFLSLSPYPDHSLPVIPTAVEG